MERLFEKYFSMDKEAENYSNDFSYMQIRKEGNKIITEYISRWNSSYNVKTIQNI